LLRRLREQTGLLARLSEAEDGKARHRYVFSHQTLREYFVALRLKEAWERDARGAWRFLRPRLHLPDWREPLALLVGSLPEPEALRLLEWILHARSPEEDFLRRDLFLAAALAAESGHAKAMWEGLEPYLRQVLKDEDWWIRRAVARMLGEIGDPQATPALIQALRDEKGVVRRAAAEALEKIGPPAVPALIQALQDEDVGVRRAAAEALGQIGDPQATPALIQALRDEKWEVRQAAAKALEKIGPPAVPVLIQALQDEDVGMRQAAAEALGQIGDPQATPALIQALRDQNVGVRWRAAEALEKIGDPQATPALIQALRDEKWEVRQAAAWALEKIGDPQATPALIQALRDEKWEVRRAAAWALLKLPPVSPPQNEQERRAWQKRLTSIRRAARRAKEYELLAAILEWEAALSPWQDPLQPPPVSAWRVWVQRTGRVALALLFAGLGALAMAVLSGIGEPLSEAVRAFVQRQPLWAAALLILILGAAVALLDWIREALRKKT
jgi:HEAT repeat protein